MGALFTQIFLFNISPHLSNDGSIYVNTDFFPEPFEGNVTYIMCK